jgi:DNA-binding NtrC family response regulator
LDAVAKNNAKTVLLLGETGTGKALAARDLHLKAVGPDRPFVEINCATLEENQIEAELFGAERGALPGLVAKRKGLLEIADGGTLLLDEVGEIPLAAQAKLLTFLETRTFKGIGMPRDMLSNVNVVAATNRNLGEAVEQGRFRRDLFYRLNVVPVTLPPLRERGDDIALLSQYFASKFADDSGIKPISFIKPVGEYLQAYPWPGNVRELKNLVERLSIHFAGQTITIDQLPAEILAAEARSPMTIEESVLSVEKNLVLDALRKHNGKKGLAAEHLGISRHALKRKIQKLGLS